MLGIDAEIRELSEQVTLLRQRIHESTSFIIQLEHQRSVAEAKLMGVTAAVRQIADKARDLPGGFVIADELIGAIEMTHTES